MEIVLAHRNMDFDCLAAQLAVTKLYPAAVMAPAHPISSRMRNFLALYRDSLPLVDLQYVDPAAVSHVFLVDCHAVERLDERAQRFFQAVTRERSHTIFDHHETAKSKEPLVASARADSLILPVGAATTILVELIKEKKIKLSPFEATVLTAGIYEDTGCLTHRGTTQRDALAVAYLLGLGADLARVMEIVRPKLDSEQAELAEKLLASAKTVDVSSCRVTVCNADLPKYIDSLADITSILVESTGSDAVISVCRMKDRIHIVGRSESPKLSVQSLVRHFSGAGHPGAASAVVKSDDVEAVVQEVFACLRSQVKPEKTAGEIMVSPIRTILQDLSMDEAGRIMLRHSVDGLVVMQEEQIAGIVSKRDVDKARHHKLDHAPVKGFMSHPVTTVTAETTVSEIQSIMVNEDIGRLPVISAAGKLLGLVSRNELLQALHGATGSRFNDGEALIAHKKISRYDDLLEKLEPHILSLYREVGEKAASLNMVAYLVGGCVRDLLLDRANADLDFVVEGSAIDLARSLATVDPARFRVLAEHERFCTATMFVELDRTREVDLATARTEYYEYPAALPTVEPSKLEHDLFRRDFTINALAMNLHPDHFGEIVDYYDGLSDMDANLIRVLHPFSFIEDPTRIVRGARFAARLGFSFERRTMLQAQRAISLGIFDNLGGIRLKEELRSILESKERLLALDILRDAGGGLRFLDEELVYTVRIRMLLRRAERLLERYPLNKEWIIYLGVLLCDLSLDRLRNALERLQLADDERSWIVDAQEVLFDLSRLGDDAPPSQIYRVLHGHDDHALAIAACLSKSGSSLRRFIKLYFEELRATRVTLKGSDLIDMGVAQGPQVGTILTKLLEAKLDGKVKEIAEEKQFAELCLREIKGA